MEDEIGPAVISAQDVQIGDHNSQVNHHYAAAVQPLGEARLAAFSAHVAAAKLLKSDHVEGVHALAEAPLDVAVDVLRVLLQHDPDWVVGLLADSHAARAAKLVKSLIPDAEWLAPLPVAIRAIGRCQDSMGWILDETTPPMIRARPSRRGSTGFFRRYDQGHIHWSDTGGAWATTGEILRCHAIQGGSSGRLGFPLTAERTLPDGGSFQRFESDSPYRSDVLYRLAIRTKVGARCGATVYRSRWGAFVTWAGVGDLYERNGGPNGWLGYPMSAQRRVELSTHDDMGWIQTFEYGAITHCDGLGPIEMEKPVADYHETKAHMLGFPVGPPQPAGSSPAGTEGRLQRFQGQAGLPADLLAMRAARKGEAAGGATVYSSDLGTFAVMWGVAELYERIGGPTSWLGFPTGDQSLDHDLSGHHRVACQPFEGGVIFRHEVHSPVAVSARIMSVLDENPDLRRTLGYPLLPASPTGIEGMAFQAFAGGIVTVEQGMPAVFVRQL